MNSYADQMSQANSNNNLSWRRLYLSKAKLKASSRTSALLSGFAMVAMVEISVDKAIPENLLILFGITTSLLVTCHLVALMISTCILPNMEAVSNTHSVQAVSESPHEELRVYIEIAWIASTGLGILLFLVEIALLSWVKFWNISKTTAIASTCIVVPAGVVFVVFSLMFYNKLMAHRSQRHDNLLEEMTREYQSTGDDQHNHIHNI